MPFAVPPTKEVIAAGPAPGAVHEYVNVFPDAAVWLQFVVVPEGALTVVLTVQPGFALSIPTLATTFVFGFAVFGLAAKDNALYLTTHCPPESSPGGGHGRLPAT